MNQEKIRNIAIIAHVDHGKTTLVDAFLKQSKIFRDNQTEMTQKQILDSGELEREKGITISAKNISIRYKDFKINIIDTPGHSDFGGEVERTLNMAEGCLLLVDAQEGPMPQTKFVLKKALELKLKPILVINKIDKKFADPTKVLEKASNLFLELATDPDQLDFPVFYAIGREGKVFDALPEALLDQNGEKSYSHIDSDTTILLQKITEYVNPPSGEINDAFQMQITNLEFDPHLGRALIGKIKRGKVSINDFVTVVNNQNGIENKISGRVKDIRIKEGLEYVNVEESSVGEIVAISGLDTNLIGATLCSSSKVEPLPQLKISNPSVRIQFEANTSPLMGKEGKFVTAKQLQQRLEREAEINISLKIEKGDGGSYYVSGRGELQLSILIETMRREGYEFQIRRPEVILKEENGQKLEPLEELLIDTPSEYQGVVTTIASERKAELVNIENENTNIRFTYKILTRNLLGLRNQMLNATKGNAVINNFLLDYVPFTEQPNRFRKGVLVSSENGIAMGYALNTIQERGELIIEPATQVYEGMIIGINKFEGDMEVNPTKERAKSGVRVKHDEITQTSLKSIKLLTLEFALLFLNEDEILEITPKNLRLRKQYLTKTQRDWSKRENLNDYAKAQLGK